MATMKVSDLSAVIADVAPRRFQDAVVQRKSLFAMIPTRPMVEPKGPVWQARTAEGGAGATFSEEGPYPSSGFDSQAKVQAQSWGRYAATIQITEEAMLRLLSSQDRTYIANYLGQQVDSKIPSIVNAINAHAISNDPEGGGDANGVYGLDALIDTGNTIGGLARSSNSWLQSAYEGSSVGTLAAADLNSLIEAVRINNGGALERPVMLTTYAVARTVKALSGASAVANQIVVNGTTPPTTIMGNFDVSQEYPVECYYNGIPVMPIDGMTSGCLYLVDLGHWWVEYLSGQVPDGSEATIKNGFLIEPFKKVQGSPLYLAIVATYLQIWAENPLKMSGKLTGIS